LKEIRDQWDQLASDYTDNVDDYAVQVLNAIDLSRFGSTQIFSLFAGDLTPDQKKDKAFRHYTTPIFPDLPPNDRAKIRTRLIELKDTHPRLRSLRDLLSKRSHARLHDVLTFIAQWHDPNYRSATAGQAMEKRQSWEAAMSKTFSTECQAAIQLYVFSRLDDLFATSEDYTANSLHFTEVFNYRCWFELAKTVFRHWGENGVNGAFEVALKKVRKFSVYP
jgi:hypothetical protein